MQLTLTIDGKKYLVDVEVEEGEEVRAFPATPPKGAPVPAEKPSRTPEAGSIEEKLCRSPIAGVVCRVVATVGEQLGEGDLLLVLEAMKMETNIASQVSGRVTKLLVAPGDAVQAGQPLAEFA